jgi:hypothetical protein
MPKIEKGPAHRLSVSTASAAGGTRSSSWSTKDDETLIQARAQGLNWNQIGPKHFPSKTPNACRKRHERLMERQNAEQWDGVKLDVLAQAYMEVRREMWSLLAARVGEKWQLVETKVCSSLISRSPFQLNTDSTQCMEKGLKNLTQAFRSAQKKLENGTYHDQDSGIGISDLEEEQEDHHVEMPAMPTLPEAHYYSNGYPSQQQQQQRVPSIQSMLHPMQHQHQHPPMQHPMQQQMHQPIQQAMQQSMQQPMQYASHHLSHQQ